MYKYIGIRGHRGSGKSSISYLLGATLNYLNYNNEYGYGFDGYYQSVVDKIKTKRTNEIDFNYVHLETFADTAISLIHMIFGIPMEDCYNDEKKDSMIINLKTFEYKKRENEDITIAETYFTLRNYDIDTELHPHKMRADTWMTLRETIAYYGGYVMKYFFGSDVWTKSLSKTDDEMDEFYSGDDQCWKIYTDVKFTNEVDYIKSHNGIIINLERPGYIKDNFSSSTNLLYDTRIDYNLSYDEICTEETKAKIKELALKIYENK